MIQSSNIFAALDTKKKKKGSSKSQEGEKKKEKKVSKAERSAELERAIFSAPKVSISNWADTDDEDEFGADLPDSWGVPVRQATPAACRASMCTAGRPAEAGGPGAAGAGRSRKWPCSRR